MQCYVGGRRSGKTRHLINLSHETGITIVTRTNDMAKQIEYDAMRIGKPIPRPICIANRASLINTSDETITLDAGTRVCQLVVMPFVPCELVPVEELSETERGTAGFGSTGVR